MPLPPFIQKLWTWIRSQTVIWVTTTVMAILTVFTQTITDRIKTGLNNADQRRQSFEKISKDFSGLLFNAENAIENYNLSLDSLVKGKIEVKNLKATIDTYNVSITTIRENQYVYKYELNAYAKWKLLIFKTDVSKEYDTLMADVIKLDAAMHRMNPIGMKIAPLVDDKKDTFYRLDHSDTVVLQKYLPLANSILHETKIRADRFFNAL